MTITQLIYVLAVAEHKNFTKAAQKTFVTQPTLSMQIQKLEEQLDILIFDRSKKPIELTSIGKKIVKQAKNIVSESERMQDIVDQEKGFVGGEFRIGIIPTIMPTLLPMFLKAFTNRYPKVNLKIEELATEEIINRLKDGNLDAAIAATPLENEDIKERVLYYEPFIGYVPADHRLYSKVKLSTSDLEINDILLLTDGHCFREQSLNLCKATQSTSKDKFQLESGSFETLIKLSDEGLGMTLLPYLHSIDLPKDQLTNLKNFEDPVPAREVALIYNKTELKLQIINAMYDLISGIIKGAIVYQDFKIISPRK